MDEIDKALEGLLDDSMDDIPDLDSLLISGVDDDNSGALEGASFTDSYDDELTAAEESAIFLDTLYEECDSLEEFVGLVEENATIWEMYGLIEDATAATEAVKKMKIDNWKKVNLDRVAAREAIRMAQKTKSPDYKKYAKFRALFKKYRDKILKTFGLRSRTAAKRAIANSANKSASIKPSAKAVSGSITNKLEHALKGLDKNGRNGKAIRESGR